MDTDCTTEDDDESHHRRLALFLNLHIAKRRLVSGILLHKAALATPGSVPVIS